MGQPVKLSDELILEARVAGDSSGRSIAGQIEFWCVLGKAMDRIMTGRQVREVVRKASARELMDCLEEIGTPVGRARLDAYLKTTKFPRFWAHPDEVRMYIREEADGTTTSGRFEGRKWIPVHDASKSPE